MSSSTNIATRNAAEAAVLKAIVTPITSVEFNDKLCRKFKRSIINAAPAVRSSIGGGAHGHIYLTEDQAKYTAHTGGTGYTKATHAAPIDFTVSSTNA